MRRLLAVLGVAMAIVAGVMVVSAPLLSAHSTLIAATPEPSADVSELTFIELRFETALVQDAEATIALATIREGQDLPIGDVVFVSDFIIRAEVPDPPPAGDYVVRYQVTSEDGDLNDGGYSFTLLPAKGGAVTWVLLGVGIVALGVVGFLLRPRGRTDDASGRGRKGTARTAV